MASFGLSEACPDFFSQQKCERIKILGTLADLVTLNFDSDEYIRAEKLCHLPNIAFKAASNKSMHFLSHTALSLIYLDSGSESNTAWLVRQF